jgi:glutathione S-transferase
MIVLYLKKIPFEVINLNLQERPDWYYKLNPIGKVPSLEHDGKIIWDSLIGVDYLEQTFPNGPQIMSKDTYERAKQRMLVERLSALAPAIYALYRDKGQETLQKLHDVIALHENLLQKSDYFGGSTPTYADYMLWPWIERLAAVSILTERRVHVGRETYPKFAAYIERMKQLPEIKEFFLDGPFHVRFIKTRLEGNPNYGVEPVEASSL